MALHDVPAEPGIAAHRALEIHNRALAQPSQTGSIESLPRHLGGEARLVNGPGCETYAVNGDAGPHTEIIHYRAALHANGAEITGAADRDDFTDLFDYPCEHRLL